MHSMTEQVPSPENVDSQIEQLLTQLDNFDFHSSPEEVQEEWYWTETEARVGEDRDQALARIRQFVDRLSKDTKREG